MFSDTWQRPGETHPTLFATDAEVAAMTPEERALHETQVSLERQKRQLELRRQAETEKLYIRTPAQAPATPRAPAPPTKPTRQEEATTGEALSSATPQKPFVAA